MKRNLILGTVFSAALAVGASAQTTGSQAGQQSAQKQSQQNQQITVTGCLQNADMTAGGTAGTTGTGAAGTAGQATGSSSSAEFMLTNAKVTSGGTGMAGTTGTGTAGTAGTTTSSSMNKFKLTGGNQQELRQYLNSQVEIRGTVQRGASDRSGAGTGTAAGTGTGTGTATGQTQSKMDENVQTIRVTSVKQVAKTCTGSDR